MSPARFKGNSHEAGYGHDVVRDRQLAPINALHLLYSCGKLTPLTVSRQRKDSMKSYDHDVHVYLRLGLLDYWAVREREPFREVFTATKLLPPPIIFLMTWESV